MSKEKNQMFAHVLKINGVLVECDSNTLQHLTTSSKTLTVGKSSASVNDKSSGWFSTGGLRGYSKAGGDPEPVKKYILKQMKNRVPAGKIVEEIEEKWGATMDKNVCYKLYNANPKATKRR